MSDLKVTLQELLHLSANIEGRRDMLSQQTEALLEKVGKAKARELLQPAIIETLERLQNNEHERSVGVFSRLLSAISKDVLPNFTKPIVLDLYTSHGAPALDIDIAADDKHKEEITSGAIKNVLSVGLRLIAIARTNQRRFLVLDEPDHWIRPENVPQFVIVLDKIIRELDFQILMISHHPSSYFSQVAKCVTLKKNGDLLELDGDLQPDPHDGIQAVRLINFESHHDTTVPLHKGMTVITGENGIGKSSFVRALKSLIECGVNKDRVILHTPKEAKFCRVEMKLDDENWIGWRRVRKLNTLMKHKNRFYVRKNGVDPSSEDMFSIAEDTSDGVPDFIQERTRIKPNDRWNIHVAGQEESVFLLNKETKATERAKILALGNEAEILHSMIEKNRYFSKKDKDLIRSGESQLGLFTKALKETEVFISRTKPRLSQLAVMKANIDSLNERIKQGKDLLSKLEEIDRLYVYKNKCVDIGREIPKPIKLNDTNNLSILIKSMEGITVDKDLFIPKVPKAIELNDTEGLSLLIQSTVAIKTNENLAIPKAFPKIPEIKDTYKLMSIISGLSIQTQAVDNSKIKLPTIPVLHDASKIQDICNVLIKNEEEMNKNRKSVVSIRTKSESLDKDISKIWKEIQECPLCGNRVCNDRE